MSQIQRRFLRERGENDLRCGHNFRYSDCPYEFCIGRRIVEAVLDNHGKPVYTQLIKEFLELTK